MTSLRTTLVGVTAASLLTLPGAAAALTPGSSVQSTNGNPVQSPGGSMTSEPPTSKQAAPHNTAVRFLRFDHIRPWAFRVHIRGQVRARVNGQWGALQGVRVILYRQLDGRSRWVHLETRRTSQEARPKFRFHVRAKANADYRVVFRGNRRFQPDRATTHVSVHRTFHPRLKDGSGRFHGRVRPRYGDRVIFLEKRWCADCGWDRIRAKRTGDYGRWRFKVGAPSSGRWWFRVSVPGSRLYIRSHSGVFTTERR
jgi:hypothetical protein